MNHSDRIVQEYTSADEERRLSMYLTYRELRNRFNEIDMSGAFQEAIEPAQVPVRPANGLSRFCSGWLRQCGFPK
jgi:hypothetical protein